jgi:protein-S-isoprenylcysteine O-methyltransferase Ste14
VAIPVLLLYALYILVAFAVRTFIHVRQTGANPVKRPRARPFSAEWNAALLLLIGATIGLAAPVLELLGISRPIVALDSAAGHGAGFVLFAIGLVLMFWSQMTMGASWRIGVDLAERSDLVTRGVFALVRNPIYSSGMLMQAGLLLLLPDPWMIASSILLATGIEVQVRAVEEPFLHTTHGEAYSRYAAKVGRFLPGMGRIRPR